MSSPLYYSCNPIFSLGALSLALDLNCDHLTAIASDANTRYRKAKPIVKPDGSIRQPFDALEPLKEIHRRIKDRILSKVVYPYYLTGSLKGKDYRANAALHAGARISICEDVEGFFPATSSEIVFDIWRCFFGFSQDVALILTSLTTKDGVLPQGAITSSYLANLAFWRHEPSIHDQFIELGIQYTRYVDDITVSSKRFLSTTEQTEVIAKLYGMLRKLGYKAKRRKHEVFTGGRRMMTTKLMMNLRVALTSKERSNIRASVFQLEKRISSGERSSELLAELATVSGRVGKLKGLHRTTGDALQGRLRRIRAKL